MGIITVASPLEPRGRGGGLGLRLWRSVIAATDIMARAPTPSGRGRTVRVLAAT